VIKLNTKNLLNGQTSLNSMEKFYVTTPIYYPNDIPHIGHAYTTLAADVISRWNKIKGKEVFFLTGTDDHGKKIEEAAKKAKKDPKEFTDELVPHFKDAWKKLNINYDRFIRTTDEDHKKIVSEVVQKIYDKGDIYKGSYEGYYCVGCEAYLTEKDLVDGKCPIHKTKAEWLKEESYFFKLSKYQDQLLELYEKHPEFILPDYRRKETVNRVKEGLKDLSISRTGFDWGIKLPFDDKHVLYVWMDALFNYYSGTRDGKENSWPADLHLIGKDILWFHTVYWPAFLLSAGLELPKTVFAHGWWTFAKEKISKSRGKVINVDELIAIAGVDPARYFLLREASFGQDGDFSSESVKVRTNNELVNEFGNLANRILVLAEKKLKGVAKKDKDLLISQLKLDRVVELIDNYDFSRGLEEIFKFIKVCNKFINDERPWEVEDADKLNVQFYSLLDSLRVISILLHSFMPETCDTLNKQLGVGFGSLKDCKPSVVKEFKVSKGALLFKKVD
jgi:methionyl-tRNA synthetase